MIPKGSTPTEPLLPPKSTLDCLFFDGYGPGNTGQMNCDDGEEISIENAWYGRTSTSECSAGLSDGMFDDEFYQICNSGLNVTTDVAAVCDGKNTCQFRLEHFGLFDPCVNIHKYTKIIYSCIRK